MFFYLLADFQGFFNWIQHIGDTRLFDKHTALLWQQSKDTTMQNPLRSNSWGDPYALDGSGYGRALTSTSVLVASYTGIHFSFYTVSFLLNLGSRTWVYEAAPSFALFFSRVCPNHAFQLLPFNTFGLLNIFILLPTWRNREKKPNPFIICIQ